MPGQQHLRDVPALKISGSRIMCMLQQAVGEGVFVSRVLSAQCSGNQARDGFNNYHGCQFTAGQHIVANRNFVIDELMAYALVDSFIAAAHQDQFTDGRQLPGHILIKCATLRRQQDGSGCPFIFFCSANSPDQRFGFHDHSVAAPKWPIIGHLMTIGCKVPNIDSRG